MTICGDQDQWLRDVLEHEIAQLCRLNEIDDSKVDALTRGLEGMIDGFWQELLYQPDQFESIQAINCCHEYLDTLFPNSKGPTLVNTGADDQQVDYLPGWTYHSKEFLELEKNQLFKKNWLLVGHLSDLPKPRGYLTLDAVGERAIVIRDRDGEIRAFHNVCRHRGAKLKDSPAGTCSHALTCPFHGWTYKLDGSLIGVPLEDSFDSLDKSANGLTPLDLEIWMGFIFVRFDTQGPGLSEIMSPVEHLMAPYQIENMEPVKNTAYAQVRPYNWKIIHDIDNEGYHVPVGHPGLQQLYGESYKDFEIDGVSVSTATLNEQVGSLWSIRHYQNLLPRFEHLPEENQRLWFYTTVFPNLVFGLYPDCLEYYMTLPLDTDRTLLKGGSYALPDSRKGIDAVRYLNRRINVHTDAEDESFVRWMQEGMGSSAFPEPKLSSRESGVSRFHHRIQQQLPVARLKNSPRMGQVADTNAAM